MLNWYWETVVQSDETKTELCSAHCTSPKEHCAYTLEVVTLLCGAVALSQRHSSENESHTARMAQPITRPKSNRKVHKTFMICVEECVKSSIQAIRLVSQYWRGLEAVITNKNFCKYLTRKMLTCPIFILLAVFICTKNMKVLAKHSLSILASTSQICIFCLS